MAFTTVFMVWGQSAFDPANPPDPNAGFRLTIESNPAKAGIFEIAIEESDASYNYQRASYIEPGVHVNVYAYGKTGFEFECWKNGDEVISDDSWYGFVMPESDITLTACFKWVGFHPDSPGDPGSNPWNAETGDLTVDSFHPGGLWSAIWNAIDGDPYEALSSLTVVGSLEYYDTEVCNNMQNLTFADFGRTSGVAHWSVFAFENCPNLTKVVLPSSVNEIWAEMFYGCGNLKEVVLYATMPPTVYGLNEEGKFFGVPDDMVVKVYAQSLDLYMNAEGWNKYKISAIDDDSTFLSVSLPDDASDDRYVNCYVQLTNTSTGQVQKLLVTKGRTRFLFGSIVPDSNMKYDLRILASNGAVLGERRTFTIPDAGDDYKFESLKQVKGVGFALLTPDGTDVSDMAAITWYDANHRFIASGTLLTGQVEDDVLSYEITLQRDLALEYVAPENGTYTVTAGNNDVEVMLEALKKTAVSGVVKDAALGQPVEGAYVTITQYVNGGHIVSGTVATDAEGNFTLEAYEDPYTLTIGSPDHFEITMEGVPQENVEAVSVTLRPVIGVGVNISLFAGDNVVKGKRVASSSAYTDCANVDYAVVNKTAGETISDTRLRGDILIVVGEVNDGDILEITATPRNSSYNAAVAEVTVASGHAEASMTFISNGDVSASYASSDADDVLAMLYDSEGRLYRTAAYDNGTVTFKGLPEGEYTLVSIMASRLFSNVGNLEELANSDLVAGTDYLVEVVSAENGYVSPVALGEVPVFDESKFIFTTVDTSIGVNKSSLTVGQIQTVRSKVEFFEQYLEGIDNVNVTFTIPEGCEYVDGSLMVAGETRDFDVVEGNMMTVSLPAYGGAPKFCIVPLSSGDYRPSATISFEIDGTTITQPLGSALFTANDYTISAPAQVADVMVTARGVAPEQSEIKVYDNDVYVGTTRALQSGDWSMRFSLYNPGDKSTHIIRAEITDINGRKFATDAVTTEYDGSAIQLASIDMVNGSTLITFDHNTGQTSMNNYSYVPGHGSFSFKAKFREGAAAKVANLEFVILLSDGSYKRMGSMFLPSVDAWVCATTFDDINRLPINVKALYTAVEGAVGEIAYADGEAFRCPDVTPMIDPSGYVYEAVPSNRIEGVTATIYYKEKNGEAVKWDAEAYAQENPLFTDAEGMYQWDVPQGEWQVVFEKEGYEAARTEWLPVPPPQLDINIGIVQMTRPEVKLARAYSQSVEVEFDKYMRTEGLTASNIVVKSDGADVAGVITLLDKEAADEATSYARTVRFVAEKPFAGTSVTLMVSNRVASYAGIQMESIYEQEFDIEPEVREIKVESNLSGYVGIPLDIPVTVLPAEASTGKILVATLSSPIASVTETTEIGKDGIAHVTLNGELPGSVEISFSVLGVHVEKAVTNVHIDVPALVEKKYELNITASDNGTVDFKAGLYDEGTMLTLTATPDEGYSFKEWSDGVTENPRTITVDRDLEFKAIFKVNSYLLTVYLNDEVYYEKMLEYGAVIAVPDPEVPEGMAFDGWNQEIPSVMPAKDLDIYGTWSPVTGVSEVEADGAEKVEIYTMTGIMIFSGSWNEAQTHLAPGLYVSNGKKVIIR